MPTPKPAEIRRAREAAGLTQTEAGALVHASLRTWQHWEAEGEEHRGMPGAVWELFNVKLKARALLDRGKVTARELRDLGLTLTPKP
jgi:DNA-binding XRE family transcriptional regulator